MINNESNAKKSYKGIAMEGFIARWYAKNTKGNMEQYKNWAKLVAENVTEGSSVLEVAPGPGYLSINLAKIFDFRCQGTSSLRLAKLGNYKVTGMDISKTFVEIEKTNAKEAGVNAEFVQGDVSDMPFDNETFDFIVCTAAFKNFTKPVMALNEMYRVLKSNGKALIIDLRKDASRKAINDEVENMGLNWINTFFTKLTFRTFLLKNAYTKDEIKELVSHTNFRKCKIPQDAMGFEIWLEK